MKYDSNFYKGKKVFITGHTGFKGSWMSTVLLHLGADVMGYALSAPTEPSLFRVLKLEKHIRSEIADIRDLDRLKHCLTSFGPEIVIHMAAQPLVRESYQKPIETYETNVMGTAHILEAVRACESVRSFVNVTTDKVYLNREWDWGYRENDELNGYDPYSNSKSCSELVTSSYRNSFFADRNISISTCRAGNVIGGGDFSKDRIIPDCIRAAVAGDDIIVRNPDSIRPYQHVLEPIMAYLLVAMVGYENKSMEGAYNVGPGDAGCISTGQISSLFCEKWNEVMDNTISWKHIPDKGPHEASILKLDCSKIRSQFGWKPVWDISIAIDKVVEWEHSYLKNEDIMQVMNRQVTSYIDAMQNGWEN